MAARIVYGDVYPLLVEWLAAQRRPFLVIPNVTAGRVLQDRLVSEGRGELVRNLTTGRVGRLAAKLVGPGEEISTIDLVIEREILRRLLPPEYKAFGAHDPFMDQVVREIDDLRRNCPSDGDLTAASLLSSAAVSLHEREAFAAALRLMQSEREAVVPLREAGIYLGADLIRAATARLRAGAAVPWSGVAVAAVHRLDSVSRELLLTLAGVLDVVFFPGPASVHVRAIVKGWELPEVDEIDGRAPGGPLLRRYVLGDADAAGGLDVPTVEAFPDRDREVRGVVRAALSCLDHGVAPRDCLVAAPRADRYAEAVAAVCSEFGVPYHVAGLRFFASLPIDRFAQSVLRYLTAPIGEEGQPLGEVLTRAGCGFVPFRISAPRDRLGARGRGVDEWIAAARDAGWPGDEVNRLGQTVRALTAERNEWQTERPAVEWLRRLTRLLNDLGAISNLGRDLVRRGSGGADAELVWEGQGTRRYLERLASFSQALAAGGRLSVLPWGRMAARDFVPLFTGEVSFGSYLPSTTDVSAIRFVDIEDVLFQDVVHLWVIDFAEGALPLDYARPFVVPERVREHLALHSGILTRERHLLLQRGNFEKVFAAPRSTLRFSYPYQDERAHTRLPSPLTLTYGLLTGPEVEQVVARRRQAHEYFPRVPAEPLTIREATGLAVQALHAPAPPETDATGVATAQSVRHICDALRPAVETALARGALFLLPPSVVDLAGTDLDSSVLPQPVPVDHLVDGGRCAFRVYARSVLRLGPPRRERWPEEPLRAIEQVLDELLADDAWAQVLQAAAGPHRLRLFREAAQRAVAGDDSIGTRGFQEYVAKRAYDYVSRVFRAGGAAGVARNPLEKGRRVPVQVGRTAVEAHVSRVDEVGGRRVAVLHVASPSAVETMWNGAFAFVARAPADGGDPRPAAAAMGATRVHAIELHSLAPGRNGRERLYETAVIDRERETDPPGDWDPKVCHLGKGFERAANESLKVAIDAVVSLIDGRKFEIKAQAGACESCGFGALCQRRWLPFPQDVGRS